MRARKTFRARKEHSINLVVSYRLKKELMMLARKYDRTLADTIRALLKLGIPMMEGLSKAEQTLIKEYVHLTRRYREMKSLKDI